MTQKEAEVYKSAFHCPWRAWNWTNFVHQAMSYYAGHQAQLTPLEQAQEPAGSAAAETEKPSDQAKSRRAKAPKLPLRPRRATKVVPTSNHKQNGKGGRKGGGK